MIRLNTTLENDIRHSFVPKPLTADLGEAEAVSLFVLLSTLEMVIEPSDTLSGPDTVLEVDWANRGVQSNTMKIKKDRLFFMNTSRLDNIMHFQGLYYGPVEIGVN